MSPEPKFKPGDVVMLRSGGPSMTVIDIGQHTGCVVCAWETGPDELPARHDFEAVTLTILRAEP